MTFLHAPSWAFQLLHSARVARLGTADEQRRPLVVPVCFVFDGRLCYTAVDGKPKRTSALRRLRNLAVNPQATLLVDEWHEDWSRLRYVMVHGRADVVTSDGEIEYALELLVGKYRQYRELEPLAEQGRVIGLKPERIVAWRAKT
jgi:PPOX class probable F420-dependent enzyme